MTVSHLSKAFGRSFLRTAFVICIFIALIEASILSLLDALPIWDMIALTPFQPNVAEAMLLLMLVSIIGLTGFFNQASWKKCRIQAARGLWSRISEAVYRTPTRFYAIF